MAAAEEVVDKTRLLWDALGEVPDRRGRQGLQYELRSVLGIALAAMLAGANDLRAIWRWVAGCGRKHCGCSGSRAGDLPATPAITTSSRLSTRTPWRRRSDATRAARRRAGTSRLTARRCAAAAGSTPRRCTCSRPLRPSSGR